MIYMSDDFQTGRYLTAVEYRVCDAGWMHRHATDGNSAETYGILVQIKPLGHELRDPTKLSKLDWSGALTATDASQKTDVFVVLSIKWIVEPA